MKKSLRAKGRKILKSKSIFHFPEYDILDYQVSMVKQLNYYNIEVDPKVKQQWAIANWKKQGKNVTKFSSVRPEQFAQVGPLMHMLYERELEISKAHMQYIDRRYNEICEIAAGIQDEQPKVEVVKESDISIQDRINLTVSTHIGEIEGFIDDFIWKDIPMKVYHYLSVNYVKPLIAKRIRTHFESKLSDVEFDVVQKERGYDKKVARVLKSALNQIISDCQKAEAVGKVIKTRKSRAVVPAKVVSKLKFMKYHEPLAMVSVSPEKILGASEVWLYDTSNRRLHRYEALDGETLTVRGTAIVNWNPETSGSKIMRKPEEQLSGSANMGKRALGKVYDETKAAVGKVSGRTNDRQVILKVF